MLGVLWYFGTIAAAYMYLLGSGIAHALTPIETAAAAVPVGTIVAPWIVYIIASLISNLGPQTMVLANLVIVWIVAEHFGRFWRNWRALLAKGLSGSERMDGYYVLTFLAVIALPVWRLYSTRMIPEEGGKIWSGGSCWADLPIHMHIAEAFLQGRNQDVSFTDMISPVFAGERMYYPFIPDFHAAVIKRLGGSLRDGFLYPGYVMALALFALLFLFTLRVSRSRLGAVLSVVLTVGAGGMGGVHIWAQRGLAAALATDTAQNDTSGDGRVFWFAFVPHILLPQRGANFAYPMVMLVLLLVWRATDAAAKQLAIAERRSLLMHAAAFAALLPLVQAHAFIGLAIVISVLFVLDLPSWISDLRMLAAWALAGATAILVGGPQMALFKGQVDKGAGGSFIKYGWIYRNHDVGRESGFFGFWWMSLGPALPLFLFALAVYALDAIRAFALGIELKKRDGSNAIERFVGGVPSTSTPADATASPAPTSDSSSTVGDGSSSAGAPREALTTAAVPVPAGVNPYTGAPYEDASSNFAAIAYSAMRSAVSPFFGPRWLDDVTAGRVILGVKAPQDATWFINALSLNGRALDTLKLGAAGAAVFFVGNYVNFQPWDRDNCKLFYIWVFIASTLVGPLLAAPAEALIGSRLPGGAATTAAGVARMLSLTAAPTVDVLAAAAATTAPKAETRRGAPPTSRAAQQSTATQGPLRVVSLVGLAVAAIAMFYACATGYLMVAREYKQYNVLLDEDQIATGKWISENIPPKAVFVHKDVHITPSGCLSGRPTLISYNGWMWSHGYNYYDRDRDRAYILANALKDSDHEAYNALRRWGVRYVQGEWLPRHPRARQAEYDAAVARKRANPDDKTPLPRFDPDSYLDGQLKRVFSAGRYDILEVQGYGGPPI